MAFSGTELATKYTPAGAKVHRPNDRSEQAEGSERAGQAFRRLEPYRAETERFGRRDVGRRIVDQDRRAGIEPEPDAKVGEIAGSGLIMPTSPDTTMPSKLSRKANRSRAWTNFSADQLVSA